MFGILTILSNLTVVQTVVGIAIVAVAGGVIVVSNQNTAEDVKRDSINCIITVKEDSSAINIYQSLDDEDANDLDRIGVLKSSDGEIALDYVMYGKPGHNSEGDSSGKHVWGLIEITRDEHKLRGWVHADAPWSNESNCNPMPYDESVISTNATS